ncbi:MAG: DUF5686 and carboxypeptidase regulatory-like domain-containing protein [Bacteroidota bacterium]
MNETSLKSKQVTNRLFLLMPKAFLFSFMLIFFISTAYCQTGIKGHVKDTKGKPLAFATLYIKELKTGTVANENGYFECAVRPGAYQIDFRCLGYQSVSKQVIVQQTYTSIDVRLSDQMIELKIVNIFASAEDPAYSIMRKAIAASYYYRMIVKAYDADIYIKGSGEIKMPKIVYKLGKSEGIDTVEYYTNESYNHIRYEYPNKYEQKVISARDNSSDSSSSTMVNRFVNASIYAADFGGTVSPLSPSAFSFYRFKLLNTFKDKGAEIHQISVIPRSKGSNVFSGDIYIVDKLWCVYNFNLKTHLQGFEFIINQMFAEVSDKTWVPINQQYNIRGSFFGVRVSWKYLASLSNYQLEINDSLKLEKLILVDEKTDREYAKVLEEERRLKKLKPESIADTSSQKEEEKFTLSDFKRSMKAYEKQARKKEKEPEIESDFSIKIDSMAFKKNSSFWDSIRPIPLTASESKRSLEFKMDSIKALRKTDSASAAFLGKALGGIVFGKTFVINKNWRLKYPSPLINLNFNTVEGFNLDIPVELQFRVKNVNRIRFIPEIRYGFSNHVFSAATGFYYYLTNTYYKKTYFKLQLGRKIQQFNPEEVIFPFFNTLTSLLGRKNYMKIYQNDLTEIEFKTFLTDKLRIKTTLGWAQRSPLINQSNFSWISSKDRPYSSNSPIAYEDTSTVFPIHKAFTSAVKLVFHPIVKYRKYNGVKIPMLDVFPVITLAYNGGFKNILGSDIDFHRLEVSIQHQIEGYRRTLNIKAFAGNTFGDNQLIFIDYKHFNGSRIAVDFSDPMNSYRLLDYYSYSTQHAYWGLHANLSMKKFLLTQLFWLNITGVRESISVNYLKTTTSPHYLELGYGLENILKIFKIETFTSYENMKFKEFGIKLGISIDGAVRFDREDD